MSANTGVAPRCSTGLTVPMKVNEGTITSSPGPIPQAAKAVCIEAVPELVKNHPNLAFIVVYILYVVKGLRYSPGFF